MTSGYCLELGSCWRGYNISPALSGRSCCSSLTNRGNTNYYMPRR